MNKTNSVDAGTKRNLELFEFPTVKKRRVQAAFDGGNTTSDAGLLLLTVRGSRWGKVNDKGAPKDAVGQEFGKVLRKLDLKRPRLSFYGLRHGFETLRALAASVKRFSTVARQAVL